MHLEKKGRPHRLDPVPLHPIPSILYPPPAAGPRGDLDSPTRKLHRIPGSHETLKNPERRSEMPPPSRSSRHVLVSTADPCATRGRCVGEARLGGRDGARRSIDGKLTIAGPQQQRLCAVWIDSSSIPSSSTRDPNLIAACSSGPAQPGPTRPPCRDGRKRPGPKGNQISIPRTTTLDDAGGPAGFLVDPRHPQHS